MLTNIVRTINFLTLAYVFGSTVWFLFIQSPALVNRIGRDRFVPLQMGLVGVLFRSLSVALLIMTVAALALEQNVLSGPVLSAATALAAALINHFFVVPRALKHGGRSLREEVTEDEQKSVSRFASEGGGEATRFWHRVLIIFVVIMLAGVVLHTFQLAAG